MSRIQPGDRVKIHFRASLVDGGEFDSSEGMDPLEFVVGQSQVLPGLERAVVGMTVGATKVETFTPQLGFGLHRSDLVQIANRADLPKALKIEIGMKIHAAAHNGQPSVLATVIDFNDQTVTMDGNHPLAGKNLRYEIQVVDVTPGVASIPTASPIFADIQAPEPVLTAAPTKKSSRAVHGYAQAIPTTVIQ